MDPETKLTLDEEYVKSERRKYIENVIERAQIAPATGELPYPMCYLPVGLRALALIISDEEKRQETRDI